jgi:hypothetical protein
VSINPRISLMHENNISMSNSSAYRNGFEKISTLAPFKGHCFPCLFLVQCLFSVPFRISSKLHMFPHLVLQGHMFMVLIKQ